MLQNSGALHIQHSWLVLSFCIFPQKLTRIWEVKQAFYTPVYTSNSLQGALLCVCVLIIKAIHAVNIELIRGQEPEVLLPNSPPTPKIITVNYMVYFYRLFQQCIHFYFLLWKYLNIHKSRNSTMKPNVPITQLLQSTLTMHCKYLTSQCIQ